MESSTIKISAIIPVYNAEKYLEQCIESILTQSLKEFELICVNDGSSDGSLEILNNYAKKDRRVKVINQKNQGAAVARNIGIENSRGKYLSILDADDFFDTEMFSKAFDKIEEVQADIIVFRSNAYNDELKIYEEMPWTLKN